MKTNFLNTLLLPFERGIIQAPSGNEKWFVLNAKRLPFGTEDFKSNLVCEQGFRPDFLPMDRASYDCQPFIENMKDASGAMVLAGRVRQVNEANIARAWNTVKPGGLILIAGDKTSGIQSLRKWAGKRTPVSESLSKHHAVVFWLRRNVTTMAVPDLSTIVGEYQIASGMFSSDGPDKASRLLAEHFGPHIRGCVADFGAGWGYLSAELLKRTEDVGSLALYEADYASLEAAKKNLDGFNGPARSFYWFDIPTEFENAEFNWVIMNPPFHTGRAADPELGKKFIEKAAKALMPGGRLLMVANRQLPYEETLKRLFKRVDLKADEGGFKVIEAVL